MNQNKTKYNIFSIIFVISTLIIPLIIGDIYSSQAVSKLDKVGLAISFTGLIISIPPYAYYKARRDEVKKQEQYDVEMLGALGQQNLDEQEEQNGKITRP